MGRVTRRRPVLRIEGDEQSRRPDVLAVEEPLEIRIGGVPFAVTMRTPGDDLDLVHGFLLSEGVIAAVTDVSTIRYCDGTGPDGLNTYNVVDVTLAPEVPAPDPGLARNVLTSSACGVCGSTSIEQVLRSGRWPLDPTSRFDRDVLLDAPDRLRDAQVTFARTGGLHGAGLVSAAGALVCAREDVGRHNAVDKVVGWALRQGRLPASDTVLVVSGRASYELTQKAVLAGIPVLAAVSAPSSLAVELADAAGLTLAGFVRGRSMNVYTHPDRLPARTPAPTPAPTPA